MIDYNYNLAHIPIDKGLKKDPLHGGRYLYLSDAPDNANVRISINANTNDEIPMKKGKSIKLPFISDKFFVSCDPVAGGSIDIIISDNQNFSIEDTPSFAFNNEAKNTLRFAPREAIEKTIQSNSYYEFMKNGNSAIYFNADHDIKISLDTETVQMPSIENTISLDNIKEKLVFHAGANETKLIIWVM